eukprot:5594465-Amphidinium_carterae.1
MSWASVCGVQASFYRLMPIAKRTLPRSARHRPPLSQYDSKLSHYCANVMCGVGTPRWVKRLPESIVLRSGAEQPKWGSNTGTETRKRWLQLTTPVGCGA